MTITQSFSVHDREHAGLLLAEKLRRFKDTKTIVIGASRGGAVIGYHLARVLHLPFGVMPCKKITNPANSRRTIGSVSEKDVIIHEEAHDIPQEYIYRQIIRNQNALKAQQALYKSNFAYDVNHIIKDKIVILVGDVLSSADAVLASIKTIKKQKPEKIIVAVPAATQDGIARLLRDADEVAVLKIENHVQLENFYEEHSLIKDEDVKELVVRAVDKFKR
jgi:putative phosphoribosyl transferase